MTATRFRKIDREVSNISIWVVLFVGLWVLLLAAGMIYLFRFEQTPGQASSAPVALPPGIPITAPALILFAHPECPCSKATIANFERVLPQLSPNVKVTIYFLHYGGWSKERVENSPLWQAAKRLPGARLLHDPDGKMAALFHVHVSGTLVFYGAAGKLLFQGGITSSRGMEGSNPGEYLFLETVKHGGPMARTLVYGCAF